MSSSIRIMIFIDGSNIHWGLRDYNLRNNTKYRIDYRKLINLLADGRSLVRTIYYCSKPVPPGKGSQIRFLDYLRHIGIQVVEKPLKTRINPETGKIRTVEKGVDVALAVDFIGMAWEDVYDVAILVSGDEDYLGAMNKVMSKGRNVEVVSFQRFLSKELKRGALRIVILDNILPQIST